MDSCLCSSLLSLGTGEAFGFGCDDLPNGQALMPFTTQDLSPR